MRNAGLEEQLRDYYGDQFREQRLVYPRAVVDRSPEWIAAREDFTKRWDAINAEGREKGFLIPGDCGDVLDERETEVVRAEGPGALQPSLMSLLAQDLEQKAVVE